MFPGILYYLDMTSAVASDLGLTKEQLEKVNSFEIDCMRVLQEK